MPEKSVRSIEEQIQDLAKKQLAGEKYYLKTEPINSEIENALKKAPSKSGGFGANIPDIKIFLETKQMRRIPVMIEVKGKKGNFIKLTADGKVDNKKKDGAENFTNVNKYAVNGAVHYANAIVEHSISYKEAVAVGINGYYDESDMLTTEIDYDFIESFIKAQNKLLIKDVIKYKNKNLPKPPCFPHGAQIVSFGSFASYSNTHRSNALITCVS